MSLERDPLYKQLKQKFHVVKGHGDWLRIPCPTCTAHNAKKLKRYVPRSGYTSNCFICGIKKDVRDLLDGYYVPTKVEDCEEEAEVKVDPRALELPYSLGTPVNQLPIDHPAIKFLHKDQLFDLDRYSNENKIVFVPFDGGKVFINGSVFITSAEHLVFPVYFEEKLVGWQLRSVPGTFYGDQPKDVRYYHIFNKGRYLYNYDNAMKNNPRRVVVVEGVKKALKFRNAVATWGSGVSRAQQRLMQKWPEVVMLLDGEEHNHTQAKARELVECLNAGGNCRAININLAKYGAPSPDEFPEDVLQEIVEGEWNDQINRRG